VPLAPVRTEAEALTLALVLREYQVPGLSFGELPLPVPALLARLVEGTRLTSLYLSDTGFTDAHLAALRGLETLASLPLERSRKP
jgi:hypothetical protein